ncbi:PfkB family carbohydrate kinase [Streptomyces sp. NPDC001340]
MSFEVLTMGRVGVDVYPLRTGVGLAEVTSFGKYLGGSPTNVAVAAARYGRSSAVITKTGRDPAEARSYYAEALRHTTVAVGNLDECEVATGEREPYAAAKALLAAGVELAVVKQGPRGVLAMDRDGSAVEIAPVPVHVVNGLGAGDAFGGALCHGLLSGWDTRRTVSFANAAGAVVAGRLACSDAMPTEAEVDAGLREASLVPASTERKA